MFTSTTGNLFDVTRSDYYQNWLREKEQIDKHKWCLSEKAGKDVGWDYASYNWIMAGHRARWLAGQRATGQH